MSKEEVRRILKEDNFNFEDDVQPLAEKIVGHPISPFFTVPKKKSSHKIS